MDKPRPTASQDPDEERLAARYAPILRFDSQEPFLPGAVGYTILRESAPSPSFPRHIELVPGESFAIEYAIWWDWDIGHLYELEHAWVYVNDAAEITRVEASWHGGYHDMGPYDTFPRENGRPVLLSEPGKHAFAPEASWYDERRNRKPSEQSDRAGIGGVLVTPLFEGIITSRNLPNNRLAHTYLQRLAFQPAWDFARRFELTADLMVPWPALRDWIPGRIAWWIGELERTIPPHERRFLRIAHRGASAYTDENTLPAFKKAAELGADAVELDVQVSADGVPVVIHDVHLDRLTNGSGLVAETPLEKLRAVRTRSGFPIPSLAETIELCMQLHLGMYIELKAAAAVAPTVRMLQEYGISRYVAVASFLPDWVAEARAQAPELDAAMLFSSPRVDAVALARAANATIVHPCWERAAAAPHQLLTQEWRARIRNANLGLVIWHEERPCEIQALRRLGVDAICSDAPDLLIEEVLRQTT